MANGPYPKLKCFMSVQCPGVEQESCVTARGDTYCKMNWIHQSFFTASLSSPSPIHLHPPSLPLSHIHVVSCHQYGWQNISPAIAKTHFVRQVNAEGLFAQGLLCLFVPRQVSHVLNVAYGVTNLFPDQLIYKTLQILDLPDTDLTSYMEECSSFIDQAREKVHAKIQPAFNHSIKLNHKNGQQRLNSNNSILNVFACSGDPEPHVEALLYHFQAPAVLMYDFYVTFLQLMFADEKSEERRIKQHAMCCKGD